MFKQKVSSLHFYLYMYSICMCHMDAAELEVNWLCEIQKHKNSPQWLILTTSLYLWYCFTKKHLNIHIRSPCGGLKFSDIGKNGLSLILQTPASQHKKGVAAADRPIYCLPRNSVSSIQADVPSTTAHPIYVNVWMSNHWIGHRINNIGAIRKCESTDRRSVLLRRMVRTRPGLTICPISCIA